MPSPGKIAQTPLLQQPHQPARRSPLILLALDMQNRIVDVGQSWEQTLGYSRAESLRRELIEFIPLDHSGRPTLSAPTAQWSVERCEFPLLTRQGSVLWFEYSAHLRSAGRVSGYLLDITAQKELEAIKNFLATFADRLQQPVASLSRSVQGLSSARLDPLQRQILQHLVCNSRALAALGAELDDRLAHSQADI